MKSESQGQSESEAQSASGAQSESQDQVSSVLQAAINHVPPLLDRVLSGGQSINISSAPQGSNPQNISNCSSSLLSLQFFLPSPAIPSGPSNSNIISESPYSSPGDHRRNSSLEYSPDPNFHLMPEEDIHSLVTEERPSFQTKGVEAFFGDQRPRVTQFFGEKSVFFDRQAELAQLFEILVGHKLAVITGGTGLGKTLLSLSYGASYARHEGLYHAKFFYSAKDNFQENEERYSTILLAMRYPHRSLFIFDNTSKENIDFILEKINEDKSTHAKHHYIFTSANRTLDEHYNKNHIQLKELKGKDFDQFIFNYLHHSDSWKISSLSDVVNIQGYSNFRDSFCGIPGALADIVYYPIDPVGKFKEICLKSNAIPDRTKIQESLFQELQQLVSQHANKTKAAQTFIVSIQHKFNTLNDAAKYILVRCSYLNGKYLDEDIIDKVIQPNLFSRIDVHEATAWLVQWGFLQTLEKARVRKKLNFLDEDKTVYHLKTILQVIVRGLYQQKQDIRADISESELKIVFPIIIDFNQQMKYDWARKESEKQYLMYCPHVLKMGNFLKQIFLKKSKVEIQERKADLKILIELLTKTSYTFYRLSRFREAKESIDLALYFFKINEPATIKSINDLLNQQIREEFLKYIKIRRLEAKILSRLSDKPKAESAYKELILDLELIINGKKNWAVAAMNAVRLSEIEKNKKKIVSALQYQIAIIKSCLASVLMDRGGQDELAEAKICLEFSENIKKSAKDNIHNTEFADESLLIEYGLTMQVYGNYYYEKGEFKEALNKYYIAYESCVEFYNEKKVNQNERNENELFKIVYQRPFIASICYRIGLCHYFNDDYEISQKQLLAVLNCFNKLYGYPIHHSIISTKVILAKIKFHLEDYSSAWKDCYELLGLSSFCRTRKNLNDLLYQNAEIRYTQARIKIALAQYDEAMKLLIQAMNDFYQYSGNFISTTDEIQDVLKKAGYQYNFLVKHQDFSKYLHYVGFIYYKNNNLKKSRLFYQEAQKVNDSGAKKHPKALLDDFGIYSIDFREGKINEAANGINNLITSQYEIYANYYHYYIASCYRILARIYLEMGAIGHLSFDEKGDYIITNSQALEKIYSSLFCIHKKAIIQQGKIEKKKVLEFIERLDAKIIETSLVFIELARLFYALGEYVFCDKILSILKNKMISKYKEFKKISFPHPHPNVVKIQNFSNLISLELNQIQYLAMNVNGKKENEDACLIQARRAYIEGDYQLVKTICDKVIAKDNLNNVINKNNYKFISLLIDALICDGLIKKHNKNIEKVAEITDSLKNYINNFPVDDENSLITINRNLEKADFFIDFLEENEKNVKLIESIESIINQAIELLERINPKHFLLMKAYYLKAKYNFQFKKDENLIHFLMKGAHVWLSFFHEKRPFFESADSLMFFQEEYNVRKNIPHYIHKVVLLLINIYNKRGLNEKAMAIFQDAELHFDEMSYFDRVNFFITAINIHLDFAKSDNMGLHRSIFYKKCYVYQKKLNLLLSQRQYDHIDILERNGNENKYHATILKNSDYLNSKEIQKGMEKIDQILSENGFNVTQFDEKYGNIYFLPGSLLKDMSYYTNNSNIIIISPGGEATLEFLFKSISTETKDAMIERKVNILIINMDGFFNEINYFDSKNLDIKNIAGLKEENIHVIDSVEYFLKVICSIKNKEEDMVLLEELSLVENEKTSYKVIDLDLHLNSSFSMNFLSSTAIKNDCENHYNALIELKNKYNAAISDKKSSCLLDIRDMIKEQISLMGKIIRKLDDIFNGTIDVIENSKAKYMEIRTMPKRIDNNNTHIYIDRFIEALAIGNNNSNKIARGILSIDKTSITVEEAKRIIDRVAEEKKKNSLLVGVDICGDPHASHRSLKGKYLKEILNYALDKDIGVVLHIGEVNHHLESEDASIVIQILEAWVKKQKIIEEGISPLHGKVRLVQGLFLTPVQIESLQKLHVPIVVCPSAHERLGWWSKNSNISHPVRVIYNFWKSPVVSGTHTQTILNSDAKQENKALLRIMECPKENKQEAREYQLQFKF